MSIRLKDSIIGNISGNASTATTLQTARTINGTSFNGSANITTANWGAARTITIGSSGKSVNGSGNVSWSLSEIGAAATSHTHNYLPLSGGTITGILNVNTSTNTTPLKISRIGGDYECLKVGVDDLSTIFEYTNDEAWSSIDFIIKNTDTENSDGSNKSTHTFKMYGSKAESYLSLNGNKFYHQGFKPTASEIGAAASSHTHNYAGSSSAGGAANSANTLATARTINGTSFNGSANITTANWGTARTITIGNTGKSVNGSGNVSWSLAEIGGSTGITANTLAQRDSAGDITARLMKSTYANQTTISGAIAYRVNNGTDNYIRFCSDTAAIRTWLGAAASSHTHSYLPLSGGTLTGSITTNGGVTAAGTVSAHTVNATNKLSVAGCEAATAKTSAGSWFSRIPMIGSDGVIEVGRYMDWHYNGTETNDYRLRLESPDWACLFVHGGIRVSGTVYGNATGTIDIGTSGTRFRTVYCTSVNQSSDRNTKTNIRYINNQKTKSNSYEFRDFIRDDLKVATYDYIDNSDKLKVDENCPLDLSIQPWNSQIGFIAQDVIDNNVGKTFVYEKDGTLSYSPSGFTAVVAQALQEEIKYRDEIIEDLRKEIELIKNKLN